MQSKVHIPEIISSLDWIIFTIILLITLFFVLIGRRSEKQIGRKNKISPLMDQLVMGRQLTLPFFIATLVATWYGGIFGVTQIAFNKGLYNLITQGVFWYLSYIIFALFLVDRISSYKAVTMPDLIGRMFGPHSKRIAILFNFFNVLPISYTIGIGLFIKLMSGWSLNLSMVIGIGIVLSYSLKGGLRSVVLSDAIQFFTMCSSVFIVLFFSIKNYGGLDFLQENLPHYYFSPTSNEGLLSTLAWGFIALSTLVDPNFYQRCFAAHSPKTAKVGILLSTLIWFCFDICTTFGAMYAKAVIPKAHSSQGYLIYSLQLLPSGLRGFFLAGILATILSTLDSYLFLAGTTLSFDFNPEVVKKRPYLHSLGILFVAFLSILMANLFSGNIKTVWKTLGSYSAGCFLLPLLYGHFSKKNISDRVFVLSCLSALTTMTLWKFLPKGKELNFIDPLYIGMITTFIILKLGNSVKKSYK